MKSNEQHPPALPPAISNDGRELWDWAGKMSQFVQREARLAELRKEIRECGTTCGDCTRWMKSSECPRERPGTGKRSGYSVGPSMNDPVCGQFVQTASATDRLLKHSQELQSLLAATL